MHSLSPCYGLLTALVLLNSVARWCNTAQFLQKSCNFYTGVHERRKDFIQGALVDFFKSFSKGAKSGGIFFSPLTTKKTAFFAEIFKFLPPSDTHACLEKSSCHPSNNWCNFKRFNTILNMKFCCILCAKWNIWQINFNCVFLFVFATLNSYILFLHLQHNWYPYRQLANCYIRFVFSLHSCI